MNKKAESGLLILILMAAGIGIYIFFNSQHNQSPVVIPAPDATLSANYLGCLYRPTANDYLLIFNVQLISGTTHSGEYLFLSQNEQEKLGSPIGISTSTPGNIGNDGSVNSFTFGGSGVQFITGSSQIKLEYKRAANSKYNTYQSKVLYDGQINLNPQVCNYVY